MKLTGAVLTYNGEDKLGNVLPSLSAVVDDLVILVDDATTDGTYRLAREFTESVYMTKHRGYFNAHFHELISYCEGDWILSIDDDEALSDWDKEGIRAVISDRNITHCWVPRKWLVPPGDRFIMTCPWYPDYQMRLFRNIPSIFKFPDHLCHDKIGVAGFARYLSDCEILHYDFLWLSREMREKKVEKYERLRPGHSCGNYYLYEDQIFETAKVRIKHRDGADVPSGWLRPADLKSGERHFIDILEIPTEMRSGLKYPVKIRITNKSSEMMYPTRHFIERSDTFVSYHWLNKEDGKKEDAAIWDNERFELPMPLKPGESADLIIAVSPPASKGKYRLQFDIVEEFKCWYTDKYPDEEFPSAGVEIV